MLFAFPQFQPLNSFGTSSEQGLSRAKGQVLRAKKFFSVYFLALEKGCIEVPQTELRARFQDLRSYLAHST